MCVCIGKLVCLFCRIVGGLSGFRGMVILGCKYDLYLWWICGLFVWLRGYCGMSNFEFGDYR